MKKEDLVGAFDKIGPDNISEEKMLRNILGRREKRYNGGFQMKKAVPIFALALVIAGSLLAFNLKNAGDDVERGNLGCTEDMVAPIINQFQIEDRHYIIMPENLKDEYGLPAEITAGDIGGRIAAIENTPDGSLLGCEVYEYIPAGCGAVVAVKQDGEFKLYKFLNFEKYLNNQDEDAGKYLELYGIYGAADISRVRFIGHSERYKLEGKDDIRSEITDRAEIETFYSCFSTLKNSSDKYFKKLFDYQGAPVENGGAAGELPNGGMPRTEPENGGGNSASDLPAYDSLAPEGSLFQADGDTPVQSVPGAGTGGSASTDMTDTGGGYVSPGSQGAAGDALSGSITIRIYNKNGVYYDAEYYINIGFISRYEVGEDFAEFLKNYV